MNDQSVWAGFEARAMEAELLRMAKAWQRFGTQADIWLAHVRKTVVHAANLPPAGRAADLRPTSVGRIAKLCQQAGPTGRVAVVETSRAALDLMAIQCAALGCENVDYIEQPSEDSELPEGSFDAAICDFAFNPPNDPIGTLTEAHRIVKPGGRVVTLIFDKAENNACVDQCIKVAQTGAGVPHAVKALEPPFGFAINGVLDECLRRAGATPASLQKISSPLRFLKAADCFPFLTDLMPAIRTIVDNAAEPKRQAIWNEVSHALRRFEGGDGLVGPCSLLVSTAIKVPE